MKYKLNLPQLFWTLSKSRSSRIFKTNLLLLFMKSQIRFHFMKNIYSKKRTSEIFKMNSPQLFWTLSKSRSSRIFKTNLLLLFMKSQIRFHFMKNIYSKKRTSEIFKMNSPQLFWTLSKSRSSRIFKTNLLLLFMKSQIRFHFMKNIYSLMRSL